MLSCYTWNILFIFKIPDTCLIHLKLDRFPDGENSSIWVKTKKSNFWTTLRCLSWFACKWTLVQFSFHWTINMHYTANLRKGRKNRSTQKSKKRKVSRHRCLYILDGETKYQSVFLAKVLNFSLQPWLILELGFLLPLAFLLLVSTAPNEQLL